MGSGEKSSNEFKNRDLDLIALQDSFQNSSLVGYYHQ
jgi:hypothetical protein